VATEAAWLNGKEWKKSQKEQKKLLTGIGLLMEGLDSSGRIDEINFCLPSTRAQERQPLVEDGQR